MNTLLKQATELFDGKTGAFNDCKHCVSVDWICPRNDYRCYAIGQNDVTALPDNFEASPLKGFDCLLV